MKKFLETLLERPEFTNALLLLILAALGAITRYLNKQWKETRKVRAEIFKRLDVRKDSREANEGNNAENQP